MHCATSDGDGNKKGFRQGGEQAAGGQNGYAGKHPVGTRADDRIQQGGYQRNIQGWDRNSYKLRIGTGKVSCQFSCLPFLFYGKIVAM